MRHITTYNVNTFYTKKASERAAINASRILYLFVIIPYYIVLFLPIPSLGGKMPADYKDELVQFIKN